MYKKAWNTIFPQSLMLVAADQVSKWAIVWWAQVASITMSPATETATATTTRPPSGTTLFTLTEHISLQYQENTGIAWSFPIPSYILIPASILLLLGIVIYANRSLKLGKRITKTILALILGGAIGNLVDRITKGFVVDFISIGWWPVFNLADSFLTTGIFLFVLLYVIIKRAS